MWRVQEESLRAVSDSHRCTCLQLGPANSSSKKGRLCREVFCPKQQPGCLSACVSPPCPSPGTWWMLLTRRRLRLPRMSCTTSWTSLSCRASRSEPVVAGGAGPGHAGRWGRARVQRAMQRRQRTRGTCSPCQRADWSPSCWASSPASQTYILGKAKDNGSRAWAPAALVRAGGVLGSGLWHGAQP